MNILRTRPLILLAMLLHCFPLARADDENLAAILKKRDGILSQILAGREQRLAFGGGDEELVRSARLALLSFRRDTASVNAEKIRQQELIVGVWEKRLTTIAGQAKIGLGGPEAILLVTDSLLQERQLLEELRSLDIKK
jgi:hypothetical protein